MITGGGGGLGAAMGAVFARAGMDVAILDLDGTTAERVAIDLAAHFGVRTMAARVDVGDAVSITETARLLKQARGGWDVLYANVGCSSSAPSTG